MAPSPSHFLATLVALLFLGAWSSPPAAAHPDAVVAEGVHEIAAGDVLEFPVEMHYHRLVGHAMALDGYGNGIAVLVAGPDGATAAAGSGASITLNTLVPCCKGATWTDHTIRVENRNDAAVRVHLRLVLLHDGVAVLSEDAEPGAIATTLLAFLATSAALVPRLRAKAPAGAGPARPWVVAAGGLHGLMWLLSALLGIWGMLLYGGGPVSGTLTATTRLPATGNDILTTHALLQAFCILLWIASTSAWVAAVRRVGQGASRRVGILGVLLGLGSVAACLAWAIEYGYVLAPALTGIASSALPLGWGARMLIARPSASTADAPIGPAAP